MKDSYGREIDYLRISVTDRCNLRCRYCMPEDIPSTPHQEILRFEEILQICRLAGELGIRKFKVTGGEPLVRKGCIDFLRELKTLPCTEQVTLTTNGMLLSEYLPVLKELGIDGINISLDTLNPKTFEQITRHTGQEQVLENILKCQELGIRTKVNSVLLEGVNNNEFLDLVHLAKDYAVDVRFIEIMPIGFGKDYHGYNKEKLLPRISAVYPDYQSVSDKRGNGPANYIKIPGFLGCIGFIDAVHGKFCNQCNRIRLTADGILKLCLYYENCLNLKELLRTGASPADIRCAIETAILGKPSEHRFHQSALEGEPELRKMSQIGG